MSGRWGALALQVGLVIAWSSGFIGAKLAADTPSVFLVLFWRFVVVAAVLAPFVIAAVVRHRIGWPEIRLQALIGSLAMFLYLATGVKAIDLGVSAGLTALIGALQPLATAALAGPVLGEGVRPRQWVGLVIGFAGVTVAVEGALGAAPWWAYGLPLLATAALVAATLVAKAASHRSPLIPVLGIQSAVSALLFAPLAVMEGYVLPLPDTGFVAAVVWFILFSTLGGYGLYWLCLQRMSATRVGSLIYLTPPVVMIWAWAMFGEPLTMAAVAGFALCLLGVGLARDARATTARAHSAARRAQ